VAIVWSTTTGAAAPTLGCAEADGRGTAVRSTVLLSSDFERIFWSMGAPSAAGAASEPSRASSEPRSSQPCREPWECAPRAHRTTDPRGAASATARRPSWGEARSSRVVLTRLSSKQLDDLVNLGRGAPPSARLRVRPQVSRQRRLDAAEQAAIVRAYQRGISMAALATDHGVRRSTISDLLSRCGVARRQQRVIEEAAVRVAIGYYQEGWSLVRIGDRLGFDAETIRRQLMRQGVERRPASR
jgi:lambda repressor-like predicted transcriptional regulator/uncharacterized protein YjiS (DUF1127 family)